jgi:hypothetical protein
MYGSPTTFTAGSKNKSGYLPTFFERPNKVFCCAVSLDFKVATDVSSCSRAFILQKIKD